MTTRVRWLLRRLGIVKKQPATAFTAEVKSFVTTMGRYRAAFVDLHSANGVFWHSVVCGLLPIQTRRRYLRHAAKIFFPIQQGSPAFIADARSFVVSSRVTIEFESL